MRWSIHFTTFLLLETPILMALTGCMVGPDFVSPNAQTAVQWMEAEDKRLKTTSSNDKQWWETFKDPVLNQLINRAYLENLNLRVAGLRVIEARAQLGTAVGNLYPQNQQLTGAVSQIHLSQRAGQARFSNIFDYAQSQLGLTASWEIDFWGKFRRAIESADASLQSAVADYDTALVSLTADVAQAYITIRTQKRPV